MEKRVYIIAEAGVNHNGSLELALKLCDKAKYAGVDVIKFQTWQTEKIITAHIEKAEYQKNNTVNDESQFQMLKKLELSYEDFRTIKKYCDSIEMDFLSTPDEEYSLDFLMDLGLNIIKVGSGDVTNIPYLRKIGAKGKKVILSTGMSTLGDVDVAYRTLKEAGAGEIVLLHCTTNYPCPVNEVNLKAMDTLKSAFHCEVGYSDHTEGIVVPIAAVARGASVIEKHFTLDKTMDGPDHCASLDPEELRNMVCAIRTVEKALGTGLKQPNESEKRISAVVLKQIVAQKAIKKGEIFTMDNLMVKRSEGGVSACYWDMVIGHRAARDYYPDESIKFFENEN